MSFETGKRFFKARTKLNKHGTDGKPESIQSVYRNTEVPASSIVLYENGDRLPNMENAKKLADYYGVNVAWLLGQSDSYSLIAESQAATNATGLSTDVVEWLSDFKQNSRELACLNELLSSHDFQHALMMLTYAMELSENNTQDPETAEIIERSNHFGISHGMKPEDSRISNRQLIKMYRNDALIDIANAFRKIAPEEMKERKG